jgi:protein-S-isoprenylcysteine O-methyltransferase Ste14
MKSKFLVFSQFFLISLMVLGQTLTQSLTYPFLGFFFIFSGGIIGILAIKHHKQGNFNIRPDIKENCTLVTHGIYSYIRHPMYLSVLTMMFGVVLLHPSWYLSLLYAFLIVTLLVKLHYEESLWICHSKAYQEYRKTTKKLLPFVF